MSTSAQPSTRDAVLSLLLEHGEMDACDLAETQKISVQAMRRHLRALAEEGLVASSTSSSGPGRPSNRWFLTEGGRERFPDGSGGFALGLLESLRSILPEDAFQELLQRQAEGKAEHYRLQLGDAPLKDRLHQLARLRRDEGYVTVLSLIHI